MCSQIVSFFVFCVSFNFAFFAENTIKIGVSAPKKQKKKKQKSKVKNCFVFVFFLHVKEKTQPEHKEFRGLKAPKKSGFRHRILGEIFVFGPL